MTYKVTEEMFLRDISKHELTIIRDDKENRHIQIKQAETNNCRFDLITWPGHLCVTGDCGTYVFSRLNDMFKFFRNDKKQINTGYWGEKLLSIDHDGGYEKYSSDKFKECVNDYTQNYWEFESEEQKETVLDQVKCEVLNCSDDGEIRAYDAASEYESEFGHEFTDFWENSFKEYTGRYIWNLYAIVHGIDMYDKYTKAKEPLLCEHGFRPDFVSCPEECGPF